MQQDIRLFFPPCNRAATTTTTTMTTTTTTLLDPDAGRRLADHKVLASTGAVNNLSESEAAELWARVVHEKRVTNKADCWVHPNKPNKKGYVQVGTRDCNRKVYTHTLAVRMTQGKEVLPIDRKRNVSHICNNPPCCQPDHLVVESAKNNQARKNCLVTETVTCPCGCDHTFTIGLCKHEPRCIRRYGARDEL